MAEISARQTFINAAIKKVAELGLENVRTKQIAQEVGVSEATMYRYYSSKEELLRDAFLETDHRISRLLTASKYFPTGSESKQEIRERAFLIWSKVYHYLLSHPEEALFLIRYRYSAYYTDEVRSLRDAHAGGFDAVYDLLEQLYGEPQFAYRGFLINYIFELTLCFVERANTGRFRATPEMENSVWQAILGAVSGLLKSSR